MLFINPVKVYQNSLYLRTHKHIGHEWYLNYGEIPIFEYLTCGDLIIAKSLISFEFNRRMLELVSDSCPLYARSTREREAVNNLWHFINDSPAHALQEYSRT